MTEMTSEKRREIIAAIQTGNKIPAIKLYREATGADLLTAKQFIESLQVALETGKNPDHLGGTASNDYQAEVVRLLQAGSKIPAVRVYRNATGCGLKQAKEAVEAIAEEKGIESKGAGCGTAVLAMLLLMTLSAWWL
jgi:ribosomal protein L7/L12